MKPAITFTAEARDNAGKGASRALRRAGKIPAILYGKEGANVQVTLSAKDFTREYNKGAFANKLIGIEVAGKTHHAVARDIQFHPVTDRIEHADFLKVDEKSRVNIRVPVHFSGQITSPGLKRGGVLNVVRHELQLICSPGAIPERIDIDIAHMDIGDSLHISHVKLPPSVESAIKGRDFTIATIAGRKSEEEEAALEAAKAAAAAEASAAAAAADAAAAAAAGDAKKDGKDKK